MSLQHIKKLVFDYILGLFVVKPFVGIRSVKNRVELADGPTLYLRGKGRVFFLFHMQIRCYYHCSTSDSLRAFRLKIQQAETNKWLTLPIKLRLSIWHCFLLDKGIILKCISKPYNMGICVTFKWQRVALTVALCEQDNQQNSVSILSCKRMNIFGYLCYYQLPPSV
jgi:hypothetical protein